MSKIYETCYVYKIVNYIDDNIYVGSTTEQLCKRMVQHRSNCKSGKYPNIKLYSHFNLHGIANFKIVLIEEYKNINRDTLRKYEDKFIKEFDSVKSGLNGRHEDGSICIHNKNRNQCILCHSISICEHNKIRNVCKLCHGSQICEHNRQRSQCKECKGSQICEHNRIRSTCKECKGSLICEHNKNRNFCRDCNNFFCNFCTKKLSSNQSLKRHIITCRKNPINSNKCLFTMETI